MLKPAFDVALMILRVSLEVSVASFTTDSVGSPVKLATENTSKLFFLCGVWSDQTRPPHWLITVCDCGFAVQSGHPPTPAP